MKYLIIILLLLSLSLQAEFNNEKKIIIAYLHDFNAKTVEAFNIKSFIEGAKIVFSEMEIQDTILFNAIKNEIKSLEQINTEKKTIDVKSVLLLFNNDNSIDSIGFGNFNRLVYKDKIYKTSFKLIEIIEMLMPQEYIKTYIFLKYSNIRRGY